MKFLMLAVTTFWIVFTKGCNNGDNTSPSTNTIIHNKIDTSVVEKKTINSPDSFIKYTIDSNTYLNLPYYDSTMSHAGQNGYIDTFTINNCKFRIVHLDTMYDGTVEKYQSRKWYKILQFETLGNHNDYDISKDLDGDGYRDLIFYWKWFGEIHFFDTTKNELNDSTNCTIYIDWTLVDSTRKIYYENEFGKMLNSPIHSNLFTFKNAKRINLASLEIQFDKNDIESYRINKLWLHYTGKKAAENIVFDKNIGVYDFNYEQFWKDNLEKFINEQ